MGMISVAPVLSGAWFTMLLTRDHTGISLLEELHKRRAGYYAGGGNVGGEVPGPAVKTWC